MALIATPASAVWVSGCYAVDDSGGLGDTLDSATFNYDGNRCAAPSGSGGPDNRWDTRAFIGLSIPLESDFNPHLDFGIRETNVNASNFVYGAEANFSLSLTQGLNDSQLRLLGVFGTANLAGMDLLGNTGIGWDFGKQSALLNIGLQIPYARGFLDYTVSNKSLRAFLELNSDSKIAAVENSLTCGAGTVLADGSDILSQWAQFLVPGSTTTGTIFSGSYTTPTDETHAIAGPQSSETFVNGETCYTLGNPPN